MVMGFTLLSLLVAFLYAMLLRFAATYVKPPKHIPRRGWFVRLRKTKVDAPLIKLNKKGDYREALDRGSRLASCPVVLQAMDAKLIVFLVPGPALQDSSLSE